MVLQLALFPGDKRRTTTLEFPKCCVIADACRKFIQPGWDWTHLPFGEFRTKATAGRLKRMGVNPGWPDYLFLSPTRQPHWVEVKRVGEKPKPEQQRLAKLFAENDVPYLISSDVGLILRTLQAWGALTQGVKF